MCVFQCVDFGGAAIQVDLGGFSLLRGVLAEKKTYYVHRLHRVLFTMYLRTAIIITTTTIIVEKNS